MRSLRTGWTAATLVVSVVPGAAASGQASSPAVLEALARLSTPTGTRISPDGRQVLYTLVALDTAAGAYRESIWRVASAGGQSVRLVERGWSPRWSPDGSRIAYLSRVGGIAQLFVRQPDGEGGAQLTRLAASVEDFAWSPDGRTIALISRVRGEGSDTTPRPQIMVLGVGGCPAAGCSVRPLTRSRRTIIAHVWDPDANIAWSPDGSRIAYSEKPTPRFDDEYLSDIHVVDVASGESAPLVARPGMDLRPLWSPDGRYVAFRTSFGSLDRFGDHGLSIVPVGGGPPRDVGRGFEGGFLDGPYTYAWTADSRSLLFLGAEPLGVGLFAVDVAGDGRTRVASHGPAKRALISVATRADAMAFVMADSVGPWEVYVSPATAYRPRRLTDFGASVCGHGPRATAVRWRNGDWPLDGVLLLPPGHREGRRYPVITMLHGGPEGQAHQSFSPELPSPIFEATFRPQTAQVVAAAGYVVFVPNFRGSGGHGRAHRRAGLVDWTATFVSDVMSGLDTLVARGIADSTRLGLLGERSGASKVLNLLASTRRFRAGSVSDPHADFVLEYERLPDFQRQWQNLFGGSPRDVPEQYRRHSPINNAGRIATPLQIVVDEMAFAAPSSQAVALHERLVASRTPGELLVYRGRALDDDLELARRLIAWLDRWLKPMGGRT